MCVYIYIYIYIERESMYLFSIDIIIIIIIIWWPRRGGPPLPLRLALLRAVEGPRGRI